MLVALVYVHVVEEEKKKKNSGILYRLVSLVLLRANTMASESARAASSYMRPLVGLKIFTRLHDEQSFARSSAVRPGNIERFLVGLDGRFTSILSFCGPTERN